MAPGPAGERGRYLVGDWHGLALAALLMLYGDFVFNTPSAGAAAAPVPAVAASLSGWAAAPDAAPPVLAQATEALCPLTFHVSALPGSLLTVLAAFGGTWLIYAGAVRPWPWVRPLFGMKPLAPRAALPGSSTAL